jgi:hypothetical protein
VASETLVAVHHFVEKPLDLIFFLHKVLFYSPHNNKKDKWKKEIPPRALLHLHRWWPSEPALLLHDAGLVV